jgi:choline kinase
MQEKPAPTRSRQVPARRYVSRITRHTLAVIMAGGRGERLKHLTDHRCKPATPFGGKFRIIDFVLSNCVNSGIRRISVMSQYKAHSLIQHIQRGWGYLRGEFDELVEVIPAQQQMGNFWYRGTADSLYQNLQIIRLHHPRHVLVLAGDHIYKMDYGPMLAAQIAPAALDVLDQGMRLVLRHHGDAADPRVDAVRQHEVDDAELAAERRGRLAAVIGQVLEALAAAAGHDDRERVPRDAADVTPHRDPSRRRRRAVLRARRRWSILHVRSLRNPCNRIDPDRHGSRPRDRRPTGLPACALA